MARALSPPPSAPLPAAEIAVDTDALYRAHASAVARWAARLGGPGIDPNDVVQDVFLVAQRRLTLFRPEGGKVTTWLFRTTEKVVQTARRKHRLRQWLARWSAGPPPGLAEARPAPGEALERRQEVESVYQVLDRMPERLRRVLVLFELEEMSTQEIADLTGARIGTVRVWLFRARARFLELHTAQATQIDSDIGSDEEEQA